jgi:putative Mg2+ transporter-C (MgtC) family protein
MLVALAACLAMIQVNLLLPTAGRPANSFVMNDPIVRRDNFVVGITTAATLWFVTAL